MESLCTDRSHCVASCSAGHCMPLLYVLGAQKAGSSSIFELLSEDGSICGCSRRGKTLPWQSKESHRLQHRTVTRADYVKIYEEKSCASKCFVEGTPDNIRNPAVPSRLLYLMTTQERGRARFIVVVREPISRDVSWFNHFVLGKRVPRSGRPAPSLANGTRLYQSHVRTGLAAWSSCTGITSIETSTAPTTEQGAAAVFMRCANRTTLSHGLYFAQLAVWLSAGWRKESIMVASLDQIMTTPQGLMRRVYGHFGLRSCSNWSSTIPHKNDASNHTDTAVRAIDCETKRRLKALFDPWNAMLFKVYGSQLGSRVPWTISTLPGADGRGHGDFVPCTSEPSTTTRTSAVTISTALSTTLPPSSCR